MSESFPQPEQNPEPQTEAVAGDGAARRKGRLGRVVPRGAGARWAVAGAAAAVIVGGGAAAVAVAGHHHGHHDPMAKGGRTAWSEPDHGGGHGGGRHGGGHGGPEGERPHPKKPKVRDGAGARGDFAKKGPAAPVPLPQLPIDQAAQKAAAAVPGGKVEGLRAIPQEGGGSAWQAVVLGPDGVRHAVTLSGTDGTPTANTPLSKA
ncbi:hypothetical protein AB0469_00040 [Streptomyces sp. NPDC093801]|uniref:hypothetical protein n=1 Tax=Streptomyces sp. NPDC093801 TaxID=3155203 RepID=UPI00344CEC55